MAQLQHQLAQWPAAAAAYRAARQHLAAGTETWWVATVGLGETLVEQGHPSAAAELLRIASALYRSSAPAPLLPKIDQLVRQSTRSTGL